MAQLRNDSFSAITMINAEDIRNITWLEGMIIKEIHHMLCKLWIEKHEMRTRNATWLSKTEYDNYYRIVCEEGKCKIFAPAKKDKYTPCGFEPVREDSISLSYDREKRRFIVKYKECKHIQESEKDFKREKIDKAYFWEAGFVDQETEMPFVAILDLFR